MNNQSQCTNCQWTGKEKKARVRNTEDGQIEYRCPKCGAYGSITEAKEKRYFVVMGYEEYAVSDKQAIKKVAKRINKMRHKEDNNASVQSIVCHPAGALQTRTVRIHTH